MQPAGGDWLPPNLPELGGVEGLDAFVQASVNAVNQALAAMQRLVRALRDSHVLAGTVRASGGCRGRDALLLRLGDPPQLLRLGHPARARHRRLPPLRVLLRLAGGAQGLRPAGGGPCRPAGAVPVRPRGLPVGGGAPPGPVGARLAVPRPPAVRPVRRDQRHCSEMDDWLQGVQCNYSIFGQDLLKPGAAASGWATPTLLGC